MTAAIRCVILAVIAAGSVLPTRVAASEREDGRASFPVAALIAVSVPDANDLVTVTGQAGAVLPSRTVVLINVSTGTFAVTRSDSSGAFSGSVVAPAGSSLLVRVETRSSFTPEQDDPARELDVSASTAYMPVPGTFFTVPRTDSTSEGVRFATASQLGPDDPRYYAVDGSSSADSASAGGTIAIQGQVRVVFPEDEPGLAGVRLGGAAACRLMFDGQGRQVTLGDEFVSARLAPTGIPIERGSTDPLRCVADFESEPLQSISGNRAEGSFNVDLTLPADLADGSYLVTLNFAAQDLPELPSDEDNNNRTHVQKGSPLDAEGVVQLLRVGNPAPPQLSAMLLANTFSNGPRGAVSTEDRARYQLSSRIAHQNDVLILPLLKAGSDEPITYQLEPFCPMLSFADRSYPFPPPIDFAFPSGELRVSVTAPDGSVTDLGSAPFVQASCLSAASEEGLLQDEGSGHVDDMLRLTTLSDQFRARFSEYGRHLVRLEGELADTRGQTYLLSQSFDVYVAKPLDLNLAVVPGTPLGTQDVYDPALTVSPPVPAEFEIEARLYPDSDPARLVTLTASGTCNRYGYGVAALEAPLRLDQPGEYVIDVTASHEDENGVLYMGALRQASVVTTPPSEATITAHGRRGIDETPAVGPQWFHRDDTGVEIGGNHMHLPYATGDVQWAEDADSVITVLTVSDATGTLSDALRQRVESGTVAVPAFEERVTAGELPLTTATTSGVAPREAPDEIDLLAYAYVSVQRPDVRVREMITDESIPTPYWRFSSLFGGQLGVGTDGDLPNDIKFQFAGVVYRDFVAGVNQYAGYGSLFVLVEDEVPPGSRVFPPFGGNPGGQDGGPIMTLDGQDIDLFVVPTAVRPGTILEVGNTFSVAAQVGPTLPMTLQVEVTAPDGTKVNGGVQSGVTNDVGYFYDPSMDFGVSGPGVYQVRLTGTMDGVTSAGQVQPPFPSGGVLGADAGAFEVYVVPENAEPLAIDLAAEEMLSGEDDLVIGGELPADVSSGTVHLTAWMPGFLLMQETLSVSRTASASARRDPAGASVLPQTPTTRFGSVGFSIAHPLGAAVLLIGAFVMSKCRGRSGFRWFVSGVSLCLIAALLNSAGCGGSVPGSLEEDDDPEGTFTFRYDPETLSARFPNLDPDWSDTVYFSVCLDGINDQGEPVCRARSLSLHGRLLLNPQ